MLDKIIMALAVGGITGLLFGTLMAWGMIRSFQREATPPSYFARGITLTVLMLFCTLVIGPLFSMVYRAVFIRLFQDHAALVFGFLITLTLGVLMSLYAWHRRMRDLPVIVALNLGGAAILGWFIPFLFWLFSCFAE